MNMFEHKLRHVPLRAFKSLVGLPIRRTPVASSNLRLCWFSVLRLDHKLKIMDERVMNVNDWLPITNNRNAKWYYSTFHNVTAMVGAGVLAFPYAMAKLGWGPGVALLVLSWVITLYTLWQMVEMHEMISGKRFDRYHELGQQAFGEKLGLWVVVPQQLMVEVGVNIVYMVTGGTSLRQFYYLAFCDKNDCHCYKKLGLSLWIIIFASPHFLLSQLPNFNAIVGVSLAATITSVSYSTIAWATSLQHGRGNDISYDYTFDTTATTRVFQAFSAIGTMAFAYAGHNVVLEIQATFPSTPEKPSKSAMWRGALVAYLIVAFCYFGVAISGYWAFGNHVEDNILTSLQNPKWLIAIANLMVVVHVIGGYQIYAIPVFDMLEMLFMKKFHFPPGIILRILARSLYVAFTCFVGVIFPLFSDLLGFFGGFAFAPTTYFLPCIMWLRIYQPKPFSLSWLANWVCIILGVIIMFVSTIGGMREILVHSLGFFHDVKNETNNCTKV